MDASRFKRRTTQTLRQPTNISAEGINGIISPQPLSRRPVTRPIPVRAAAPATPTQPAPNIASSSQQPAQSVQSIVPVWQQTAATPKIAPPSIDIAAQPQKIAVNTVAQPVAPRPASAQVVAPVTEVAPIVEASEVTEPVVETPATPAPTRRFGPLDMGLPGGISRLDAARAFIARGKWFTIRKWAFRGSIAGLVLIIGVGGLLFSQGAFKLHKVFKGTSATVAALKTNVNPDLLKGEGDGRINVLLLGRGGGSHEGPDLTDTMMLASIDPVNKTESLVSIPRDLWVTVPNAGSMKINAAWETGEFRYLGKIAPGSTDPKAIQAGFDMADQTVESVLDVTIDYNVIVDFDAFQQAVTTVGGVTVNVPTDLVDPTMAWQNNHNPVLAKAGIQTFNGGQALNYVRSRETTSDFARSQRQRAVMVALKDKVETLGTLSNPLKISQLINAFGDNVSSDMSLSNADRMYSIVSGISDANTSSIGFADKPNNYITTGSIAGQSVDLPTAGLNNYTAIQDYIHSQLKDGYILKENAKVMVYNGTTLPGIATAESNTLKSYGYNVIGAANTPNTGWTQTTLVDLSGGKDKYTSHYLEQRFNTTALTKMPDNTIATNGADFVIIIGSDEATSTKN
jgi:LCP family protein required for cell wall assembly